MQIAAGGTVRVVTMSSIVRVTLSGFILVCRMNPRSPVTAYPANEARSGILHH